MSFSRLLRWAAVLAAVFVAMKVFHVGPADLWQMASGRLQDFKEDTVNLTSGQAVNQVTQQAYSEARKIETATPAGNNEMSRELQAERARVVEAKFGALENPQRIGAADRQQLSEQVVKSARQADGGN